MEPSPTLRVERVEAGPGLEAIRTLFQEYQADIAIDLGFQGFEQELATLPGEYRAPHGVLLLAWVGDDIAGCCAFRPLHDCDYANACEMKRLFVRRAFRGFGIGRLLVDHTLMHGRQAGYDVMLLDTLSDMETARALYAQVGFEEIPPYYHNPLSGAHYLKVAL
jgi:putative acetyltransferase